MASSALHPLGPWWDGSVTVPSTETPLCTVAKSQLLSCCPSPARLAQAKDIHVSILVFVSSQCLLGCFPTSGSWCSLAFQVAGTPLHWDWMRKSITGLLLELQRPAVAGTFKITFTCDEECFKPVCTQNDVQLGKGQVEEKTAKDPLSIPHNFIILSFA